MNRTIAHRRGRLAVAVPVTAFALLLAACGGSGDDADATPSSGTSGRPSALGPVKAAAGDPVVIGFVSDGTSAAIDTSDEIKAARAVVAYANEHLAGVGGRPIRLEVCELKASPATAADCANTLVAKKVVMVSSGTAATIGPVAKTLQAAGVPLTAALAADPAVLGSPSAFSFANPLNPLGGAALIAKARGGVKKAVVLGIDVPAGIGPARLITPLAFGNIGATATVVPITPGTPDMSSIVASAERDNPDQYHVFGDVSFCTTALKVLRSLAVDALITGIDRCVEPVQAKSIPGGYKGLTVATSNNLDPATEDYQLYDAILKTYGNGLTTNPTVISGYQGMLGAIRALNAVPLTDVSAAGALAALKAMPPTPLPLGGGGTFQCNGKQIALSPAICSTVGFSADVTEDGQFTNFKTLNDPSIYATPPK